MKRNLTLFFCIQVLISLHFVACKKKEEDKEIVLEYGSVSDLEGHAYRTVKIGKHWWMAENLRSTKFNDDTDLNYLPIEGSDSAWSETVLPTYTYIDDSIFGCLYNGRVLMSNKNIAPIGWHVATDEEWMELERTIGVPEKELNQTGWRGSTEANQLASKFNAGWPEGGVLYGTGDFGFNAVPGGCRIADGRTNVTKTSSFWWSKNQFGNQLWYRYIDIEEERIFRQHTFLAYGMSIRCVKD